MRGLTRLGRIEPRFETDALVFDGYYFRCASVAGSRPLQASAIREVCVGWSPPSLVVGDEVIFVSARRAHALADWAAARSIPFVRRIDVWARVLDPFLDTWMEPEFNARRLRECEECGVTAGRVRALRRRVGFRMSTLTWLSLEWAHYGLFDVLRAMQPLRTASSFRRFYREAMEIALLGKVSPATVEEFRKLYRRLE